MPLLFSLVMCDLAGDLAAKFAKRASPTIPDMPAGDPNIEPAEIDHELDWEYLDDAFFAPEDNVTFTLTTVIDYLQQDDVVTKYGFQVNVPKCKHTSQTDLVTKGQGPGVLGGWP